MWTNVHSGLRWLAVSLIWAGAGQYLQSRIYVERRMLRIRRAAHDMGAHHPPTRRDPSADSLEKRIR
jgi:hypothetical protein